MKTINHNPIHRRKTLPLTLAALLVATAVSHATPTVSPTRSAWTVAVQNATTEPILTQSFNGTDTVDTDIPVATETFNVFGNFSVYYETFENVDKASYDYAFDSSTDRPLDLGIDIGGSDRTTSLEFRFASPQIGFAADFASVDIGEGLILTLFNGTTPTGETVNMDAILTAGDGDGFVGFTTDLPFTSFAFNPIPSDLSMVFHLDEISTAEAGDGEEEEPSNELPFISAVSLSGGTFFCTLSSSIAGQSYQLQSNRAPSLNQWINIGDIVTGNGGPLDFQAPAPANDTENFYRVEITTP
ncbi:MAG: hypothetical protein ABF377_04455 [Akkermansiaceae bacterium]